MPNSRIYVAAFSIGALWMLPLSILAKDTELRMEGIFNGRPSSEAVSLVNLLATPDKYQGKSVRVRGVLRCRNEDNAIYLSKEDSEYHIRENAVAVNYTTTVFKELGPNSPLLLHRKYVELVGDFSAEKYGRMGLPGVLKNVSWVKELKPVKELQP